MSEPANIVSPPSEEAYLQHLQVLQDRIWPPEIPKELHYPFGEIAITEYLRRWARQAPDHVAYIYYGRRITYGELDRLADQCAALLQDNGIGPGDPVAVFIGNCPQFVIVFFGILRAGGIHVPVNPMFKEHELVHELTDTGAKLVLSLIHI